MMVPLDASDESSRAIPWADALAVSVPAEVLLARGVGWQDLLFQPISGTGDEVPRLIELAEHDLERSSKRFQHVHPRIKVMRGEPDELASLAHEEKADLIVMATHGRGGVERSLAGSVMGEVIADAGLPVLSIGPNVPDDAARAPRVILAASDGSELAKMLFPALAPLARALKAKVILFRALETIETLALQGALIPLENPFNPRTEELTEDLGALADGLRAQGLSVDIAAGFGGASSAILEAAEQEGADMIALTTHSRRGLAHWVLGSVAEAVIAEATVPVFVYHPKEVAAKKKSA
ncbi:MAG TPA: universal stress protein [Chloroflexota bacterium]